MKSLAELQAIKEKMKNMLSGEIIEKAELEPYGFAVLRSV